MAVDKKILWALTAFLGVLILFAFTILNPAQCPEDYTQEQVETAACDVGANIGLGLFVTFIIIPCALVLIALWVAYWKRDNVKKQLDKVQKQP